MDTTHLFIYSSVGGHLGCISLLATVNYAAVTIRGHMLLFFLPIYLEVELLVHMITLFPLCLT